MPSRVAIFLKLPAAEKIGITASAICAVHCLATPLALALLPAYAGELWESAWVHYLFALAVAFSCALGFFTGYLKHRDWLVLVPLGAGLALVLFGTLALPESLGEQLEMPIVLTGSMLVVVGHILNYRRAHVCCSEAHTRREEVEQSQIS